jgi:hypothetical protein
MVTAATALFLASGLAECIAGPFRLPVEMERMFHGGEIMSGTVTIVGIGTDKIEFGVNAAGDSLDCVFIQLSIFDGEYVDLKFYPTDDIHANDADSAYLIDHVPPWGTLSIFSPEGLHTVSCRNPSGAGSAYFGYWAVVQDP